MTHILKNYLELQFNGAKIVKNYTCLLVTDYSNYKGYGTGIFIKIQNSFFLVTAAHVFDNFENLMIPINKGKILLKPGGESIVNNPETSRENDNIDIGILKLDEESVIELSSTYSFLDEENLLINHKFHNEPYYTFFGYPSSFAKFSQTKESFHVVPFFQFTTPAEKSIYDNIQINSSFNVVTSYDRKRSYNMKIKSFSNGPDLYGISGCGLWFTDPMHIFGKIVKPQLVAIMTDWPVKNRKCIIGTRIDIVTESIRKRFNLNFPESNLLSLNM